MALRVQPPKGKAASRPLRFVAKLFNTQITHVQLCGAKPGQTKKQGMRGLVLCLYCHRDDSYGEAH